MLPDSGTAMEIAFMRETIPVALGTLIIFLGYVWAAVGEYFPMGFIIMITVIAVSLWYQKNCVVSQYEVQLCFSVGVSLFWWLGSSSLLYCLVGSQGASILFTLHLSNEELPFTRGPFVLLVLRIISVLSMLRAFPNFWHWIIEEIEHIDDLNVIYHRHQQLL